MIPLRHGDAVTRMRLQSPPRFLVYYIFGYIEKVLVNGWIELTLTQYWAKASTSGIKILATVAQTLTT